MFSKRLETLRKTYKLTQKELGDQLKVTKQTVSNWESGNILPSIDTLILICKFFHVSTDYILGFDDKTYIEVSDLPLEVISHIQQIINDIKNTN